MIEQGIFFALGCILTALVALCFTPLLWRRALRLTRRRLQLQVPLSMQEILAERDQLRAEFAVERVRMEQAMARIRATKHADMAELGRRAVEVVALADQVATLRGVERAQDAEIGLLRREKAETGAESGAARVALYDAHALADRLKRTVEDTSDAARRLREDIDAKDVAIARLETQLAEARRPRGEGLGGWLKATVAQVTGLDIAGHDGAGPDGGEAGNGEASGHGGPGAPDDDAARDRENATSLRQSLRARAEREGARGFDSGSGLSEAAAPLADHANADHANADHAEADHAAEERADQLRDEAAALRAENEALRGALAVARREAAAVPFVDHAADAALRDSIHALGLAVATMTRDAERRAEREAKAGEADPLPGLAQGSAAPTAIEAN